MSDATSFSYLCFWKRGSLIWVSHWVHVEEWVSSTSCIGCGVQVTAALRHFKPVSLCITPPILSAYHLRISCLLSTFWLFILSSFLISVTETFLWTLNSLLKSHSWLLPLVTGPSLNLNPCSLFSCLFNCFAPYIDINVFARNWVVLVLWYQPHSLN